MTLKKICQLARQRGPLGIFKLIGYGLTEAWYERRFGIKTLSYMTREDLGFKNRATGYYAPTAYVDFRKAMKRIEIRPGEDVFLDFGSGMGRAVIMAATYPFRKVIGVELSAELTRIAEENLRRTRKHLVCRDVKLLTEDATAYAIANDVTVIYLYNPFRSELLRTVFANIRASLDASPRRLSIVYKNPVYFEQDVGPLPWLEKTDAFQCMTGHQCAIYRAVD